MSYVSNSCWDDCNTQEKLRAKVMQNVWVQIRCIMKDRCANGDLLELGDIIHSNSLSITHKGGFSLGLQRWVSQGFQGRDPQGFEFHSPV